MEQPAQQQYVRVDDAFHRVSIGRGKWALMHTGTNRARRRARAAADRAAKRRAKRTARVKACRAQRKAAAWLVAEMVSYPEAARGE